MPFTLSDPAYAAGYARGLQEAKQKQVVRPSCAPESVAPEKRRREEVAASSSGEWTIRKHQAKFPQINVFAPPYTSTITTRPAPLMPISDS